MSECEELQFLRLEAENMALSLEVAGIGRPDGRMCTPLERYRRRYPRGLNGSDAPPFPRGPVENQQPKVRPRRIKYLRAKPSEMEIRTRLNTLTNAVNVLNGHPSVDYSDQEEIEKANAAEDN